ncbi:peroxisomal 2,4-dienoyl-CoA reductase [(3E)-enoyl-CoA-producing]-like [Oscarella lobularis]|uniref:peroxisomal 2,4-dienoyl-CoA reductase [(3E)-enoyl-CoA-producing]-like n=1 Tax=Oscarella lobularis TaxID=121494 RepID=UPI0033139159
MNEDDTCLETYKHFFARDLLRNKVAFITGGGSGICFRIAEIFMRHQCNVVIASRKLERVESAAKKLRDATGQRCLAVQLDVRNPTDVNVAIEKAIKEFGKIDILVNGAAGNFLCPASNLTANGFKTVISIDTLGTFNVSKAIYDKWMMEHGGTIINITATLHYTGVPMQMHAGAAKAAIEAMSRHLAVEWGPNIRINCIAPGPIERTEGFRRLGGASAVKDAYQETIPLQRFGTREEIANACLYFASDVSSYTTGATLVVDGGSWMTSGTPMKTFSKL